MDLLHKLYTTNFCTTSKIYENLIFVQLLKIAKNGNIDLTGEKQHGFKQGRSKISRALDNDEYFLLGSLDLSSAFNVINRNLLYKRMDIMGLPPDIIGLIF